MDTKELTVFFSDQINQALGSGTIGEFTDDILHSIQRLNDGETKDLFLSITELLSKQRDAQDFISDLSKGEISSEPPVGNMLISPFKQLHANLLHLNWQVQRLSEGDFNQQIDFLGDFSLYFNKLVESLKEKSEIENELKNNIEKYRVSIENANIGIMTVDYAGKILASNKECVNIFGFSQSELEEMTINEIALSDDKNISPTYMQSAIVDKKRGKGEFIKRYVHKSGKVITGQISSSLMYDENGEPMYFISHIKDITLQVEADRALKEMNYMLFDTVDELKQANAVKDKFSRIIAHDLKNHFNSILGFSEILADNIYNDSLEEIHSHASIIRQSSLNAYKLLENLLQWSMSQIGKISFHPQEIAIENLLSEVLDFTAVQILSKEIAISYNIPDGSVVYADANMLRTILRNLIGNAAKFTGKKGKIKITTAQNAHEVLFVVSDTGIGITADVAENLFLIENMIKAPEDNNQNGTGFGLLLCKEFVDKHEGRIWVESVPGKGSDFKFTLPVKPSQ